MKPRRYLVSYVGSAMSRQPQSICYFVVTWAYSAREALFQIFGPIDRGQREQWRAEKRDDRKRLLMGERPIDRSWSREESFARAGVVPCPPVEGCECPVEMPAALTAGKSYFWECGVHGICGRRNTSRESA